jgi:hypothetical protein
MAFFLRQLWIREVDGQCEVAIRNKGETEEEFMRLTPEEAGQFGLKLLSVFDPQAGNHEAPPLLEEENLHYLVGADQHGDVVLAFTPKTTRPLVFAFTEADAKRIADGILEVLNTPRPSRYQARRN